MFLTFYTIDGSANSTGELGSLTMDGNFVFCALVIIVNVKILINSYQYTWPAVTLIFLSIASFFIVYYVLC